jgi:hypothetical protein
LLTYTVLQRRREIGGVLSRERRHPNRARSLNSSDRPEEPQPHSSFPGGTCGGSR